MKSNTIFKSENSNTYLYDINSLYVLNLHPIVEDIHSYITDGQPPENLTRVLSEKYPELSDFEVQLYQRKYSFLKSKGFFDDVNIESLLSGKVSPKHIESQLVDLGVITLQVTGECNLNCRYCCYGELYDGNIQDTRQPMDFDTVQKFFEYIIPFWNLNPFVKFVNIGFYGGEPLMNFSLIEQTVAHCKVLEASNNVKFDFSITTNAVLLDKYKEYLVEHDFRILFSLDGDEKGNSLRVDKSNRPSFERVFGNIKKLQKEYPDFFKNKVNFNSVLNNNSPVTEVNDFIFKEFEKIPMVATISEVGLDKEKIKQYLEIMQPYIETDDLVSKRKERSSRIKDLGGFFYYYMNNSYKHYSEMLYFKKNVHKKIPTGTCLPFYRKLYITSDRKIYACERIGFDHVLGTIDEKVNIDFEEIANKYNKIFAELIKQCSECFLAEICTECLFQFPFENDVPKCPKRYEEKDYKHFLSKKISLLENHPEFFDEVNKMTIE